jgi:hypothetical protein
LSGFSPIAASEGISSFFSSSAISALAISHLTRSSFSVRALPRLGEPLFERLGLGLLPEHVGFLLDQIRLLGIQNYLTGVTMIGMVDVIIAEGVVTQDLGLAVMNRLRRAANFNIIEA